MAGGQPPIELILSRNLMANLATPAFLVDGSGDLVFFNAAASAMLGVRFEETGPMSAEEWGKRFAPIDASGRPILLAELPLMIALQSERACHDRFQIKSAFGDEHEIEVSAFPLIGRGGKQGAIAIFWPAE